MQSKIRLESGRYKAVGSVVVSQFLNSQELNYEEIRAGQEFEVPVAAPQFGYFVTYHPDFGEAEPQFERVS